MHRLKMNAIWLSGFASFGAHAGQTSDCNEDHKAVKCDIPVNVYLKDSNCFAAGNYVFYHRNSDTRKVVLRWTLTDPTGHVQLYQFNPALQGVELVDANGYFTDDGPEGKKSYKWIGENNMSNTWFFYHVHVQYQQSNGQIMDCIEEDPIIVNRD